MAAVRGAMDGRRLLLPLLCTGGWNGSCEDLVGNDERLRLQNASGREQITLQQASAHNI
jgi:hypothetical protein